jgi:hypothetical protein
VGYANPVNDWVDEAAMTRQLPLPGIDLRPICPLCGQAAAVLGQVHPKLAYRACPDCCRKYALPTDAWGEKWQDQPYAVKAQFVEVECELRERLTKPTVPTYHRPKPYYVIQLDIPICHRCGRVHDRMLIHTYASYCQQCDDEWTVEMFFEARNKIFQGDDEGALDRLYRSHPGLFERGVLPNLWFTLLGRAR